MKKLIIDMKKFCVFLISIVICQFLYGQNIYNVNPKKNEKETDNTIKSGFMSNFPYYKMIDWKPGMRFMSSPDIENSIVWLFGLYPEKIDNVKKDLKWKIFIYEGLKEVDVSCPKGNCKRTYLIFNNDGDIYTHKYIGDTIELRKDTVFDDINQLIYLDDVDKAKDLLLNKQLYIKTNQWLYINEKGNEQYSFDNQKYIPVIIKNIGVGNQDGPVKMIFSPLNNDKEYCLNVRFSGINNDVGVFGIDFEVAFQFDNPKNEFPNISAQHWTLIQNSKVRIGMNKKECILSWGQPEDINKTIVENVTSEQWIYSSSSYLYFKNGILTSIQN